MMHLAQKRTQHKLRARTGTRVDIPPALPQKIKAYREKYGLTHVEVNRQVEAALGQSLSIYAVAGIEHGKGERCGKHLLDAIESVVHEAAWIPENGVSSVKPPAPTPTAEREVASLTAESALFNRLTDSFNKMSPSDRKTLVTVASRFATDADIQGRYLRLKDSIHALTKGV